MKHFSLSFPNNLPVLVSGVFFALAGLACASAQQPNLAATLDAAVTQTIAIRQTRRVAATLGLTNAPTQALTSPTMLYATDTAEIPTLPAAPASTETPTIAVLNSPVPTVLSPLAPAEQARPNGKVIDAVYLPVAPVVDGNLQEWELAGLPNAIDKNVFGAANWQNSTDASGIFAVGWNEQALWLAVKVADDVLSQTESGVTLWKGDSLELQWDADLAGDFNDNTMSADDAQFGFSPGKVGGAPEVWRWMPQSVAGVPGGAQVAITAGGIGLAYQMEISLSWATLNASPQAGKLFGFALNISDNDQPTAAQESMVSSVGTRLWGKPASWGTLRLGGK